MSSLNPKDSSKASTHSTALGVFNVQKKSRWHSSYLAHRALEYLYVLDWIKFIARNPISSRRLQWEKIFFCKNSYSQITYTKNVTLTLLIGLGVTILLQ